MKTIIKFYSIILILLFLYSCNNYNNNDIIYFLNSNDKTEIIKGCSLLKDKNDTIFAKYLIKDMDDVRISHDAEFYGISVCEAKIKALRRISGLIPPNKITYEYDSLNTIFYIDWALKKGFIKNK